MKKVGLEFLAMLKESVIVQAAVTLMLIGVITYLGTKGRLDELPKEFWMIAGTIVGHWFGAKGNVQLREQAKEMIAEVTARLEERHLRQE